MSCDAACAAHTLLTRGLGGVLGMVAACDDVTRYLTCQDHGVGLVRSLFHI